MRAWSLLPQRRLRRQMLRARRRQRSAAWCSACRTGRKQDRAGLQAAQAAGTARWWSFCRSESRCWRRRTSGCACRPRAGRRKRSWKQQRRRQLQHVEPGSCSVAPMLRLDSTVGRRGRRQARTTPPTVGQRQRAAAACLTSPLSAGRLTSGCRSGWRRCKADCG